MQLMMFVAVQHVVPAQHHCAPKVRSLCACYDSAGQRLQRVSLWTQLSVPCRCTWAACTLFGMVPHIHMLRTATCCALLVAGHLHLECICHSCWQHNIASDITYTATSVTTLICCSHHCSEAGCRCMCTSTSILWACARARSTQSRTPAQQC